MSITAVMIRILNAIGLALMLIVSIPAMAILIALDWIFGSEE